MSASVEVSTGQVRAHERLEFWRDSVSKNIVGIDAEFPKGAQERFDATLRMENKGPLVRLRYRSDPFVVTRTRRNIDQHSRNAYGFYRELSRGAWFEAGTEFVTRRGSFVISDADRPFQTRPFEQFEDDTLIIPKAFIDPHLPGGSNRPLFNPLKGHDGVEALALALVDSLGREWDRIPEAAIAKTADALGRLVAVACGAAAGEHREAVSTARLAEARRYVDRRLADPRLSAERAAAALSISERTLHKIFEASGTRFAAHVRQRRLEECRAALLANPTRPVIDIAFAWGFGSMPSFYRAFQGAFGLSPGEAREELGALNVQGDTPSPGK
jgi:AraC-like DNA-binding protein